MSDNAPSKHIPVLQAELLDLLQPKKNENFIDATLGGGGIAKIILSRTAPKGIVIGIDRDHEAIERAKRELTSYGDRLNLIEDNFQNIELIAKRSRLVINGIYFDLGISTDQLIDATRGISFRDHSAPLDMRMSPKKDDFTAAGLLNNAREADLTKIFTIYGEEPRAAAIARAIVTSRKKEAIETVGDLLGIIQTVYPKKFYKRHPATKVWQAVRIAINNELEAITHTLPKAFSVLAPGGRLAVISFHSLEDRIAKTFFKKIVKEKKATLLTKKIIRPTRAEILNNRRSRSAKLRAILKKEDII